MSLELVKKSLDLVAAGSGLPSTSSGAEEAARRSRKAEKRRGKKKSSSLFESAEFAAPPASFGKRRKQRAAVQSRLEIWQTRPQPDVAARNLALLHAADKQAKLPASTEAAIRHNLAHSHRSQVRARAKARQAMEAGHDWLHPPAKPKKKRKNTHASQASSLSALTFDEM